MNDDRFASEVYQAYVAATFAVRAKGLSGVKGRDIALNAAADALSRRKGETVTKDTVVKYLE